MIPVIIFGLVVLVVAAFVVGYSFGVLDEARWWKDRAEREGWTSERRVDS